MPARKPYLLKKAEGNRGKRKMKEPILAPAGALQPTTELDAVAMAEWARIVAVAFWIRPADAGLLTIRCLCWSRWVAAEQDVAKRGLLVRTRNGDTKNSCVQLSRDYRETVISIDAKLGLSSIDRERISSDEAPKVDPLDEAMFGAV